MALCTILLYITAGSLAYVKQVCQFEIAFYTKRERKPVACMVKVARGARMLTYKEMDRAR